jgi:hypothetical protein
MASEYVEIDGHMVDVNLAQFFYDMRTGERLTDEQWDESIAVMNECGDSPFAKRGA